eukprot:4484273-Pleurochrysis_carterae.AAC.1
MLIRKYLPFARVCSGSIVTSATSRGGSTVSVSATPVKSSMYTCRNRGAASRSAPCGYLALRACAQRRAASGGGCS